MCSLGTCQGKPESGPHTHTNTHTHAHEHTRTQERKKADVLSLSLSLSLPLSLSQTHKHTHTHTHHTHTHTRRRKNIDWGSKGGRKKVTYGGRQAFAHRNDKGNARSFQTPRKFSEIVEIEDNAKVRHRDLGTVSFVVTTAQKEEESRVAGRRACYLVPPDRIVILGRFVAITDKVADNLMPIQ